MNQKFKIQLVALVAALSSTAWSPSHAQQEFAYSVPAGNMPQPDRQAQHGGNNFGTVVAATPISNSTESGLPPIVSAAQASRFNVPAAVNNSDVDLPPIVSPGQYQARSSSVDSQTPLPEIPAALPPAVTTDEVRPVIRSGLLAPLMPATPEVLTAGLKNGISNIKSIPVQPAPSISQVANAGLDSAVGSAERSVVPAAQWLQAPTQNGAYLNTGFSAAGVPLFAGRPGQQPDAAAQQASPSDSVLMPPVISGESQLITPIAPTMPAQRMVEQPYTEGSVAPGYFGSPPMESPVLGNYQEYGNEVPNSGYAMGGGSDCPGCENCGPDGCFDQNSSDSRMGYFGAMSQARRYAELDLLYMTRTDGDIVLSNFGGVGSFDAGAGWRGTLGLRFDETNGREFSYFGTTELDQEVNRADALGRLSALFVPSSFFSAGEGDPFTNAELQNERIQTDLHSVEFNKVRWGWDVVKSFIGLRYIYVDDEYEMFSQRRFAAVPPSIFNPAGSPERVETGNYRLNALNHLIGVHVGRELFYDVGYRLSFSGLGKAGVYANVNQFESTAANGGVEFLNNEDDNSTLATSLELNLTGHYQINRRARFRFGYQGLFLDNVATVSDNLSGSLSPFLGANSGDSDSMYFHGVNLGLEFYR